MTQHADFTMTRRSIAQLFTANLRRAVLMSIVVGTILVLINHGDHIHQEPVCDHFFVKGFLSYLVPFVVSIVSAMLAARTRRPQRQ